MKLVQKLLKENLSLPQLLGYGAASLLGLTILLLGIQLYADIRPIFLSNESFFKKDFLVLSKKVSILKTFGAGTTSFSPDEVKELERQPFVNRMATFSTATFGVYLYVGGASEGMENLSTELFFEAIPDDFLDVESADWKWKEGDELIPIILPRSYIHLYNFGFAQSQGLPPVSETTIGKIGMSVRLSGNGKYGTFKARIVGFTNKINTILVPQNFLAWANQTYGNAEAKGASRLLVEVKNPADPAITEYVARKGYEFNDDKLDVGKAAYFLRTMLVVVLAVGVTITLLAVGLLLLSMSLLIHKNRKKLENLALMGYTPQAVAAPYQRIALTVNLLVFVLALGVVLLARSLYIPQIELLTGAELSWEHLTVSLALGLAVVVVICLTNYLWIKGKVADVFKVSKG